MFQRAEERFLNEIIGIGEAPGSGRDATVRPSAQAGEISLEKVIAGGGVPAPDPAQEEGSGWCGGSFPLNWLGFDGYALRVPQTPANLSFLGKKASQRGAILPCLASRRPEPFTLTVS